MGKRRGSINQQALTSSTRCSCRPASVALPADRAALPILPPANAVRPGKGRCERSCFLTLRASPCELRGERDAPRPETLRDAARWCERAAAGQRTRAGRAGMSPHLQTCNRGAGLLLLTAAPAAQPRLGSRKPNSQKQLPSRPTGPGRRAGAMRRTTPRTRSHPREQVSRTSSPLRSHGRAAEEQRSPAESSPARLSDQANGRALRPPQHAVGWEACLPGQ